MNTPDRNKTNHLIAKCKDYSKVFQDESLVLVNMFKEFANQFEAERDFADQLNDELSKANAQLVKLCTGLEELNTEVREDYDDPGLVYSIKKLLKDANWTDDEPT